MSEDPTLSSRTELIAQHRIPADKAAKLLRDGRIEQAGTYFPPGKSGVALYNTDDAIRAAETPQVRASR